MGRLRSCTGKDADGPRMRMLFRAQNEASDLGNRERMDTGSRRGSPWRTIGEMMAKKMSLADAITETEASTLQTDQPLV